METIILGSFINLHMKNFFIENDIRIEIPYFFLDIDLYRSLRMFWKNFIRQLEYIRKKTCDSCNFQEFCITQKIILSFFLRQSMIFKMALELWEYL